MGWLIVVVVVSARCRFVDVLEQRLLGLWDDIVSELKNNQRKCCNQDNEYTHVNCHEFESSLWLMFKRDPYNEISNSTICGRSLKKVQASNWFKLRDAQSIELPTALTRGYQAESVSLSNASSYYHAINNAGSQALDFNQIQEDQTMITRNQALPCPFCCLWSISLLVSFRFFSWVDFGCSKRCFGVQDSA